jgi:poly(3-hydroxybutyrate) depolymerase
MLSIRSFNLVLLFGASLLLIGCSSCSSDKKAPDNGRQDKGIKDGPNVPRDSRADLPQGGSDFKLPKEALPPPSYSGQFPTGRKGDVETNLTVGGQQRKVHLYLPASIRPNSPLLISFHGSDQSAYDAVHDSAADKLVEAENVIVAAPQARRMPNEDWDGHGPNQVWFETYPNVDPKKNPDIILVRAIMAEAKRAYNVDLSRVYVIGFSNGAFFSLLVGMTLNYQVAAFATASGGLVLCDSTPSCKFRGSGTSCSALASQGGYCNCKGVEKPGPITTSGRLPPAYMTHAANDDIVTPYYTCTLADRLKSAGYQTKVEIRASGGHDWGTNYASNAYAWLKQFHL